MSIDSSISYLLFALFLLYMSGYVINISKPFTSYLNYESVFKNSESLSTNFITGDLSRDYLNNICNNDYANVVSTRALYEVEALILPAFDESVDTSNTGVHLRRTGDSLTAHFNTNEAVNFDFILVTNEDVEFTTANTEAEDDYNMTRSGETVTINIYSDNTGSDTDDYVITTSGEVIIFLNYYINSFEQVYLGTLPLAYSCGEIRSLARKSYFNSYAVLEEMRVIASYGVEVWWE